MRNHTEVLNYIIEEKKYEKYLEIGTQHGMNFFYTNCKFKTGIDPDPRMKANHYMTSDDFFEQNKEQFQIIFIDGLHTAEQVKKDFINAMACLSDNGIICIHDTSPEKQEWTIIPRETKQWTGDVYKFICDLDAEYRTLEFDYGITVIKKSMFSFFEKDYEWDYFQEFRRIMLHTVTEEEFKQWL